MSARTKAFVNLYAAIGTLEKYVELVPEAKEVAKQQNVVVRFKVNDGPDGLIEFKDGKVRVFPRENNERADIVLPCKSPEFFNDVVDGKAMPIPTLPGIFKALKFMGKPTSPFNVLTAGMTDVLRRTEFANDKEKRVTTVLSFYAMVNGIAQVGNNDRIARFAMKRLEDGEISVAIRDEAYATLTKKDGRLTATLEKSTKPRAFMTFGDIDTAWGLISGQVDAMSCISAGTLETSGQMLLLDNVNKILNIVPKYLQ
ncbi:MAG: hypothetical protein GX959_05605 [Clostridiales bacterium]|jgi:putative sterol carrier protein|nr:hypothetical protein [Clostridiales bacterium]